MVKYWKITSRNEICSLKSHVSFTVNLAFIVSILWGSKRVWDIVILFLEQDNIGSAVNYNSCGTLNSVSLNIKCE